MEKFKLKNDKYRKARGGISQFLDIYCANCKNHIILYQKDAIGPLKRMYMDRIFAPKNLVDLQAIGNTNIKSVPAIKCSNCKAVIATPYIYEKENRPAFLMNPTAFIKKKSKGVYPPEKLQV